jgi:antitoxin (DNA-binding transcriptional repressor) of toxin-antitoxin stability system
MKRYTVAQARSNFSRLLDAAETGDAIVIERRGTRFRLEAERRGRHDGRRRTRAVRSIIAYIDPAVSEGQWTWEWAKGGLRFSQRRRRR